MCLCIIYIFDMLYYFVRTYIYIYMCMYVYTCKYSTVRVYIHIYIYVYIYVHKYELTWDIWTVFRPGHAILDSKWKTLSWLHSAQRSCHHTGKQTWRSLTRTKSYIKKQWCMVVSCYFFWNSACWCKTLTHRTLPPQWPTKDLSRVDMEPTTWGLSPPSFPPPSLTFPVPFPPHFLFPPSQPPLFTHATNPSSKSSKSPPRWARHNQDTTFTTNRS